MRRNKREFSRTFEQEDNMATRIKRSNKAARTEIVGVRLDPRLRYLSEIAARAQHRTLSSFIEFALDRALEEVTLQDWRGNPLSISDEAGNLWDVDEVDRWAYLAIHYPYLLTIEEQAVWRLVKRNGFLWRGNYRSGDFSWSVEWKNLILTRLRDTWDKFCAVARGEADESTLPTWDRAGKDSPVPNDDDIPF
jgi:hypothetical protein